MATTTNQCADFSLQTDLKEFSAPCKHNVHLRVRKTLARLKSHGVHSTMTMITAGFRYTGDGDTARCDTCQLEVSEWTKEMQPFFIHAEQNPKCPFVRSILSKSLLQLYDQETSAKRQKTDSTFDRCSQYCRLMEVGKLKQIRRRTYSHWPHRTTPSAEQMIAAGFFACNVGDRVICVYCNLICQQWTSNEDDPSEVHKNLSPKCPYVISMLLNPQQSPALILNEISANNGNNPAIGSTNTTHLRLGPIVYTTPCHAAYSNITKRLESFATWSNESSPSVDDLARAGFFYTGSRNIVTCFYCNGSLQNWSNNDNPTIEHVRWFSHCAYAKQLSGDELHRKVQQAKQAQQERERANQSGETSSLSLSNNRLFQTNDSSMLARLVAARLDLSISQRLLNQDFKLSIIKRCWEDQLQLNQNDFISDCDLLMACIILQKQIDHIKGNKDNIIIPNIQMKLIRERKESGLSATPPVLPSDSNQSVPITSTIESATVATKNEVAEATETSSPVSNPCIICCKEEKRLACIPCGHLATCVSCSHSLRTCPLCRKEIEAFVRIYI